MPEQPRGRYLSMEEREEIFAGVEGGETIRAIACALDRAPSTVMRELRRNMRQQYRNEEPTEEQAGDATIAALDYRPSLSTPRRPRGIASEAGQADQRPIAPRAGSSQA